MTSTLQTKLKAAFDVKANKKSLSTVATSGSYSDLKNKPFETVGDGLTTKTDKSLAFDEAVLDAAIAEADRGGTDQTSFDSLATQTAQKFSELRTYADNTFFPKSGFRWVSLTYFEVASSTQIDIQIPSMANEVMVAYGRKNGGQSYGGGTIVGRVSHDNSKPCFVPVYTSGQSTPTNVLYVFFDAFNLHTFRAFGEDTLLCYIFYR